MAEIWMPIAGHPGYQISDHGNVMNKHGKLIGSTDKKGYRYVSLLVKGKRKNIRVSRLVLAHFSKKQRKSYHQAAHNDGKPPNNHIDNLRWASPRSNAMDMLIHGTALVGEKSKQAKLKEADVIAIREAHKQRVGSMKLARQYNVNHTTIFNIIARRTWKHI